jgi:hypothetical protein
MNICHIYVFLSCIKLVDYRAKSKFFNSNCHIDFSEYLCRPNVLTMNEKGNSGRKSGEKRPRISREVNNKKDFSAGKERKSEGRGGDSQKRESFGPSRGKESGYKSGQSRDDRGTKRDYKKDESAGFGERDSRRSSAPERGGRFSDRSKDSGGFKPYGADRDDRGPKREFKKDDSSGFGDRDSGRSSAPERGGRFSERSKDSGSFRPHGADRDDRGPKREFKKDDSSGFGDRDSRRFST